jgi:flagellar biosynthesis GTPase FlhF
MNLAPQPAMATRIKRYEAEEEQLAELMLRIETEMGPGAQLEVKPFKRNAIFGIGGQKMVEVVATVELGDLKPEPAVLPLGGPLDMPEPAQATAIDPLAPAQAPATAAPSGPPPGMPEQRRAARPQQDAKAVALDEVDSVAVALLASRLYEGSSAVAENAAQLDVAAYYPGALAEEVTHAAPEPAVVSAARAAEPVSSVDEAAAVAATAPPVDYIAESLELAADEQRAPQSVADDYDDYGIRAEAPEASAAVEAPAPSEIAPIPDIAEAPATPETAVQEAITAAPEFTPAKSLEQLLEPPEYSIKSEFDPSQSEDLYAEEFVVRDAAFTGPGTAVDLPEHAEEIPAEVLSEDVTPTPEAPAVPAEAPPAMATIAEPEAVAPKRSRKKAKAAAEPEVPVVAAPQVPAVELLVDEPAMADGPEPAAPGRADSELDSEAFDALLDWDISRQDVAELLTAVSQNSDIAVMGRQEILSAVEEQITRGANVGGGIQLRHTPPARTVAIVGPTGVGKTTTVCKLAAHFAFEQDRKVGLVSLDNYRIAATEQLRTYAEIADLELDLAFSPQEYAEVVQRRRDSLDLLLVDTAGRSPTSTRQVAELAAVFDADPPDEVHLVIGAGTRRDDLRHILEVFKPLNYSHIILSKLDETRNLGILHNITRLTSLPISYFTIGQGVPEDIEPATLPFIRQWLSKGKVL